MSTKDKKSIKEFTPQKLCKAVSRWPYGWHSWLVVHDVNYGGGCAAILTWPIVVFLKIFQLCITFCTSLWLTPPSTAAPYKSQYCKIIICCSIKPHSQVYQLNSCTLLRSDPQVQRIPTNAHKIILRYNASHKQVSLIITSLPNRFIRVSMLRLIEWPYHTFRVFSGSPSSSENISYSSSSSSCCFIGI